MSGALLLPIGVRSELVSTPLRQLDEACLALLPLRIIKFLWYRQSVPRCVRGAARVFASRLPMPRKDTTLPHRLLLNAVACAAVFASAAAADTEIDINDSRIRFRTISGDSSILLFAAPRYNVALAWSLDRTPISYNGRSRRIHLIPLRPELLVEGATGDDTFYLSQCGRGTAFANGISVFQGDGSDRFYLCNARVDGDLFVAGGVNAQSVGIYRSTIAAGAELYATSSLTSDISICQSDFDNNVFIAGGIGIDEVAFEDSSIAGDLRIFTRESDDQVRLTETDVLRFEVETGSEADQLELIGSSILFESFVSTGDGDDSLAFVSSDDGATTRLDTMILDAGAGNDSFDISEAFFGSFVQLDLGTGTNNCNIDDTRFDGQLQYRDRGLDGLLNIEQDPTQIGASEFRGMFTAEAYAGGHMTLIGQGAEGTEAFFFQFAGFFGHPDAPSLLSYFLSPYDPFTELYLENYDEFVQD